MPALRIAVLHASAEGSTGDFAAIDPERDPSRWAPEHAWTHVHLRKATAAAQLVALARDGFDVYLNHCDGAWDEDRPGVEVVMTLERLGLAFTGASARHYDPSRTAMKMAAHSVGVDIPAYVLARTHLDVERAAKTLPFPLLVKHPQGYSSVGLTPRSRVADAAALAGEAAATIGRFGAALIETFVPGREFTVLVAEALAGEDRPWVAAPIEFEFPPGETFKHFDLKWRDFAAMRAVPVTDAALDARLRDATARVFDALGCDGYARCDFRLAPDGRLVFLEINPNASVYYPPGQFGSSDEILAREPGGHAAFLTRLVEGARARQRRAARPWEVRFDRDRGFELVATRALREGDVAVRYEEHAHRLTSRRHVERTWQGRRREWFDRYAYPVSAEVFALWSEDPDDWRPINHACDPNTWLDGLDLVARRPISEGEPLTVDYASFCGPDLTAFECACGAAACRRVIRGLDFVEPSLRARFEGHLSDFVRSVAETSTPDPIGVVPRGGGLGLVARRPWRAGETVVALTWANEVAAPARYTLQLADERHAEPRPFELRFLDHGCAPNVCLDVDAGVVRALVDIAVDDPLTAFYPSTEWDQAEAFSCRCGAPACLGTIRGAAHLPTAAFEGRWCSRYVAARLAARDAAPR